MNVTAKVLVVTALTVLGYAGVGLRAPAWATIQDESCWSPDIEYPVPCDDED